MLTRIITGVIGIAAFAYVIQLGGEVFAAGGAVLALLAWFEFSRAFDQKGYNVALIIGGILIAGICTSAWYGNFLQVMPAWTIGSALLVLAMLVLRHGDFSVPSASASLTGIFYIGIPFAHFIALRFVTSEHTLNTSLGNFDMGCALIWVALIGTWSSDTFAYFAGSFFGRHKLCPVISPKKTVEGFIGGLAGTTAALAGVGYFFGFDTIVMAALGFCVCLVATLGDLVESVMKRYTGIKDSGNLIPGHGGVWDRFDSVLYTVPFVYYFVQYIHIFG